ncbi:uncharacterized protein LOC113343304 [Papaver somniferum]|uniref:uncharacterized protein LOC113343304 n=1 Tax=Papaver somniferum TaxID=3469 RepID=UPI000E705788|nr:uncharacterized protein LOC113343304 [Papaver somniferum]
MDSTASKDSSYGDLIFKVPNPNSSSSSKSNESHKKKPSRNKDSEGEPNREKKKVKKLRSIPKIDTTIDLPVLDYKLRPHPLRHASLSSTEVNVAFAASGPSVELQKVSSSKISTFPRRILPHQFLRMLPRL